MALFSFALPLSTRGVELLDPADGVTSFPLPLSNVGVGVPVWVVVRIPAEELEPFVDFGAEVLASIQ